MGSKNKVGEIDYVSFDKDLNMKCSEKIIGQDAKIRIKLCVLLHHHKQKQNLDKELHNELLKLKRNYEKKTFDIVKQVNQIVKSDGSIVLKDFSDIAYNLLNSDINDEPIPYPKLPNFWPTCIKNCPTLMYVYSNKDGEIAKSIETIDITREDSKSQKSFTLSFQLSEDQKFFTNPQLQVTFYLIDSVNPYRQESNAEFKTKTNKETSTTGIFLQLFQNINLEDGLHKTSDAYDYCSKLGRSYEIALMFKDELIPYSLEYYLDARNPQLKKEVQEKKLMEKIIEKKQKPKSRFIYQQEEGEGDKLADEKYLEDNQCKQY